MQRGTLDVGRCVAIVVRLIRRDCSGEKLQASGDRQARLDVYDLGIAVVDAAASSRQESAVGPDFPQAKKKGLRFARKPLNFLAPEVGLEPTTP